MVKMMVYKQYAVYIDKFFCCSSRYTDCGLLEYAAGHMYKILLIYRH